MANRERPIPVKFMVNETEHEMLKTKMKQYGTENMGAYLRKIAIDGYVIKKDYGEIKKLTAELGKIGSNVNQIAKRANESRNVYKDDVQDVLLKLSQVENLVKSALGKLL